MGLYHTKNLKMYQTIISKKIFNRVKSKHIDLLLASIEINGFVESNLGFNQTEDIEKVCKKLDIQLGRIAKKYHFDKKSLSKYAKDNEQNQ